MIGILRTAASIGLLCVAGGLLAQALPGASMPLQDAKQVSGFPTRCDNFPEKWECRNGIPISAWDYYTLSLGPPPDSFPGVGSYVPSDGCPHDLPGGPPHFSPCPSHGDALEAMIFNFARNLQFACPNGVQTSPPTFVALPAGSGTTVGIPYHERGNFGFQRYSFTYPNGVQTCSLVNHFPGAFAGRIRQVACPAGWEHLDGTCVRERVNECRSVGSNPFSSDGGNGCICTKANPVNPQSGMKQETESDFVGPGVFPLTFVRSYRSSGFPFPIYAQREGGAMPYAPTIDETVTL